MSNNVMRPIATKALRGWLAVGLFSLLLRTTYIMKSERFTAILEKDGDMYLALCPELDIASQGPTVEEAKANLKEAVELFLECADSEEVKQRLHTDLFITQFEVFRAA